MPPRKRAQSTTSDVGGVLISVEQIELAIEILTSSSGIMVRQPLARVNHPLAAADYHAVAAEQRQIDETPKAKTKAAFIAALVRLAAGD